MNGRTIIAYLLAGGVVALLGLLALQLDYLAILPTGTPVTYFGNTFEYNCDWHTTHHTVAVALSDLFFHWMDALFIVPFIIAGCVLSYRKHWQAGWRFVLVAGLLLTPVCYTLSTAIGIIINRSAYRYYFVYPPWIIQITVLLLLAAFGLYRLRQLLPVKKWVWLMGLSALGYLIAYEFFLFNSSPAAPFVAGNKKERHNYLRRSILNNKTRCINPAAALYAGCTPLPT